MKPYYEADGLTIFCGDCRDILPLVKADAVVTDPPYGDTSLPWDRTVDGWVPTLRIAPAASIWCWGSMRFWLERAAIDFAGWTYAQDVVWEKHNGTNSARPNVGPTTMNASSNIAGPAGILILRNSRPKPPGLYNNACQ